MKRNIILLVAALLPCVVLAQTTADDPQVRRAYVSSAETPSALVFKAYTGVVHRELGKKGQEGAEDFVMFTLETDDRESVAASIGQFEEAYWRFVTDELDTNIDYLCRQSAERWTDARIYESMDTIDDVVEQLTNIRYQAIIRQLDPDISKSLRVYLDESKDAFQYYALDHENAWKFAEPDGDMQKIADEICANVKSDRTKL